ncbi:MAG: ABC transporter ATP-binding protein [Planctomycetota bacterium]|nr:ABC transporter ATP-binding protein [Planctomycetota bacterium]
MIDFSSYAHHSGFMFSMINATGLTRTYGSLVAVDRLSFEVPSGVVCGFLGPNGAGKSTTIRMIAGLFPPDSGSLLVGGVDARRDPLGIRRQVGYLPESNALYPELRIEEYVRFRGRLAGLRGTDLADGIDRAIGACGLGDVRRRLIGSLSRGFRQRTGLAAALVADPPLLILDEPTVGLDPVQQVAFRRLLDDLSGDRTVVLSSHLLSEVQTTCSWLVMISGGRLLASGPRDEVLHGGRVRVHAQVDDAHATRLLEACRSDPGFSDVLLEGASGPRRDLYALPSGEDVDGQALLGRIAAELGVPLRALGPEEISLESIFLAGTATSSGRLDRNPNQGKDRVQ